MVHYKNHSQIYTHSTEYGVIIGQYWTSKEYKYASGRVMAITEDGDVILQPDDNFARAPHRYDIDYLTKHAVIELPVLILPYKRVNKKIGIQVFAFQDKNNITPYVFGELRRAYEPW
jgi:hypothetical protein